MELEGYAHSLFSRYLENRRPRGLHSVGMSREAKGQPPVFFLRDEGWQLRESCLGIEWYGIGGYSLALEFSCQIPQDFGCVARCICHVLGWSQYNQDILEGCQTGWILSQTNIQVCGVYVAPIMKLSMLHSSLHVIFLLSQPSHLPSLTNESRDSVSVMSSLALVHSYSSTRLEIGSERAPLPESPMLPRHLDSPSDFLPCEFTTLQPKVF